MAASERNTPHAAERSGRWRPLGFVLRLAAIVAFVALTNDGFLQRVMLVVDQERYGTLIGFAVVWSVSLVALLIAAFQPNRWVRGFWALIVAVTTAVGFAFRKASGNELSILDVVSLWGARHEAGRAMEFYSADLTWAVLCVVFAFIVMAMPPVPKSAAGRRWLNRLAWAPAVPAVMIAAIVLTKEGGGMQALPTQFAPLSVAAVAGSKLAVHPVPERNAVAWTPGRRGVRHIVLLVDESVRADFIDWTLGNASTPELAKLRSRVVDFGPAVSGGNCSHYSNAILRFAAGRDQVGPKLLTNPTLWQYAKKAGFRTVYIDAQAAFNRSLGKLQNFMTATETRDIDAFYALDAGIAPSDLDDRLLDVVVAELKSDQPVFIYANKNGAHFPYDRGYPAAEAPFRPTMSEAPDVAARINSYRNVVRWSVDRFFRRLFAEAALDDSVLIYTSDHGQNFDPRRLSHCSVEEPDPREALVPLFVVANDEALRARFATAAQASAGHASHFSIAPTLLELFGYQRRDLAGTYRETMLEGNADRPAFTTGDVFGLFASKVRWHMIDLLQSFREPVAKNAPTAPGPSARVMPTPTTVTR